jgi:hypothetical protein
VNLLVHGVVEASSKRALASSDLPGATPGVELISHHELAALVTPTPDDEVLPSRANLLHHTRVLETAGARTTVVPMRFGVLVPEPELLVRDYLAPRYDDLLVTLDRLRGHVELRLRARYVEHAVIAAVLAADPKAARLRGRTTFDAKMELGERIVAGIEQRRQSDLAWASDALRDHAADVAPGDATGPLDAFLLSFLVADTDRQAFEARIDRLGHEFAPVIELELVGPVPPFSFAAGQVHAWV